MRFADRVQAFGPVVTAQRVFETFGLAGGGLLAGGLTYAALFALLPGLLLLTGILGFIVDDAARQAAIVEQIGDAVPPLRDFIAASLDQITEGAAGFGLIGLVGLAWGASRFYTALDDAFARIFRNVPTRGLVERTIRGVASVVLLVTVFVATLGLTGVASFLVDEAADRLGIGTRVFWQVATPALAAFVFVIGVGAVYRIVPARRVTFGALWKPALLVGIALALLTQLFSLIAPRLIGAAAVYGTFVALFAAMVWLSSAFQLLLIGAAWVRERLGPAPPPFLDKA